MIFEYSKAPGMASLRIVLRKLLLSGAVVCELISRENPEVSGRQGGIHDVEAPVLGVPRCYNYWVVLELLPPTPLLSVCVCF